MSRTLLETISDLAVAAGAIGGALYIYFSFRAGGFKPLRGTESAIANSLAAAAFILWLGSRVFSWWPMVFFHLAIGYYMSFMGLVGYRLRRRKL